MIYIPKYPHPEENPDKLQEFDHVVVVFHKAGGFNCHPAKRLPEAQGYVRALKAKRPEDRISIETGAEAARLVRERDAQAELEDR